ncbi:MAG: chaperone NapD [Methylococcaceae bacterium]
MNIVGILINTLPAYTNRVVEHLKKLGIEIHGVNEKSQIVITLEQETDEMLTEQLTTVQQIQGVLTAAMVYHHVDE